MSDNNYIKYKTDLISCALDFGKDDLDAYELYVLTDSYIKDIVNLYKSVLEFKDKYALECIKLEHFNLVANTFNLPEMSKNIDSYQKNNVDVDIEEDINDDTNKYKFISEFVGNIKDIGDLSILDLIVSLLFNLIVFTVCGFIGFGYILPKLFPSINKNVIPIIVGVLFVVTCVATVSGLYCKELKFIKNNSKHIKKASLEVKK